MNESVYLEGDSGDRWSRREQRLEARRERREHSSSGAWVGGLALILLGVVFLAQNLGGFYLNNWWALFILYGAVGSFSSAWNGYRSSGQVSSSVRGSFVGDLVLTLVGSAFLFNLAWAMVWPVFLIIAGLSALLATLLPRGSGDVAD